MIEVHCGSSLNDGLLVFGLGYFDILGMTGYLRLILFPRHSLEAKQTEAGAGVYQIDTASI